MEFTLKSLPDDTAATPARPQGDFMLKSLPSQSSTFADVAKSAGTGLTEGAAALIGLPGDAARAVRWLASKAGIAPNDPDYIEGTGKYAIPIVPDFPTSGKIIKGIEGVTGELHQPETTAGQYARTISSFAPATFAGPGGLIKKAAETVIGGFGSEAAGQATKGTALEPYARVAGGVLGVGAPSVVGAALPGAKTANAAISQAMKGVTSTDIDEAARIMGNALGRGVRLTWAEALQQATNGRTGLGNLQRIAEGEPAARSVLAPMMAERPQAVRQAVESQLGEIAPAPAAPSQIGPALSQAAEAEINNARQRINRITEPLYEAGRQPNAPQATPQQMAILNAVPGFSDALAEVRGNPHLNRGIETLPDTHPAVLSEAARLLKQKAENVGSVTNPDRNLTVSASQAKSAGDVRNVAEALAPTLGTARQMQTRLRSTRLEPMQTGIVGNVADAGGTRAAAEALLPPKPIPGSAAEIEDATRRLATRNPEATAQAIRTRLEDAFNQSAKDLQGGQNAAGGANFRAATYGREPLRQAIRAAVGQLPNGADLTKGLDDLMEVLAATGRRQAEGSPTAEKQALRESLSGGSPVSEIAGGTLRLNPMREVADRLERWRLGSNLQDIAKLLADPAARDKLTALARLPRNAPNRAQLQISIVNGILNQPSQNEQGRKPSQAVIDTMLRTNGAR